MGHQVWGNRRQRRFFTHNHWNEPLIWNHDARNAKRRRRVFCGSMADVFERKRELNSWRERLGTLISATPCLDWLLVTKRPENIEQMVPWGARVAGPRARTMHPDWAASLLHQCQKAEVPFHFKQWGHWVPAELTAESRPQVVTFENERSVKMVRLAKKVAGRILEGSTRKIPSINRLVQRNCPNPFRFIFLDPKGWADIPMQELRPFLSDRSCEVLINLIYRSAFCFELRRATIAERIAPGSHPGGNALCDQQA
jgi:Protein of unknown function (DUF5131)